MEKESHVFTNQCCEGALKALMIAQLLQNGLEDILSSSENTRENNIFSYLNKLSDGLTLVSVEDSLKRPIAGIFALLLTAKAHFRDITPITYTKIKSLIEEDRKAMKKAKFKIISGEKK